MSNRNAYIDFLRGGSIILVVIGHAIQSSIMEEDSENCSVYWFEK